MIFAIDPGPVESAICIIDPVTMKLGARKLPNQEAYNAILHHKDSKLAIEIIANMGMPAGETTFTTAEWIGAFCFAHSRALTGPNICRLRRIDVKLHICGTTRAKDQNVRAALIDRFGEPGTKKRQGKLYGFAGDMWSALAIGLTCLERKVYSSTNGSLEVSKVPLHKSG